MNYKVGALPTNIKKGEIAMGRSIIAVIATALISTVWLCGAAFSHPYFLISTEAQWQDALLTGHVEPVYPSEWNDYMIQWDAFFVGGEPYPDNEFVPPIDPTGELYAWAGGGGGGLDPADPGLVMVWRANPDPLKNYASAWRYDYGPDPDLSNATISVTVIAPQFSPMPPFSQINNVSFGIVDTGGAIRSWQWNVGPGKPIPYNTPTQIVINPAMSGVTATTPTASGAMSNPVFNVVNSQSFIVDENASWVGSPMPAPPPGGQIPGIWNYWQNLMVWPNPPPKNPDPLKWSQPVVEYIPNHDPPIFLGWDEFSMYPQLQGPPIAADDWMCEDARPVTDIHWWGSFIGWDQPVPPRLPDAFHIGIWTDVPTGPGVAFSHPGTMIWQNICTSYTWNFAGYDYDPRGLFVNEACFQFHQYLKPEEWFHQQGDQNIYWLSIAAIYYNENYEFPWGWKTRPHYFNDAAVKIFQVTPGWPPTVGSNWVQGMPVMLGQQPWDLAFELTTKDITPEVDWGDAPDPSYPTLSTSIGANHILGSGLFMGATVDAEGNGQPHPQALGDDIAGVDDEDGVTWTRLAPGVPAQLRIIASAAGLVDAWIDWNGDGSWAQPGDQILAAFPVVPGVNVIGLVPPPYAFMGPTYSRFRISSVGGLPFTGPANDGEVEDYFMKIEEPPIVVNKGQAKYLPINQDVLILRNVVTANFGQLGWYFEEPDLVGRPPELGRSAGLGVNGIESFVVGDLVSVYGKTMLSGCEFMIDEYYAWLDGTDYDIRTVGQNNRDSGGGVMGTQPGMAALNYTTGAFVPGVGLNSVGLLVRLWGRCTCVETSGGTPMSFWIDDGSSLWDSTWCAAQTPALGVKVRIPPGYAGAPIKDGKYYAVTGIMKTYQPAGVPCARWLWPRFDGDINLIPE